MQERGLLEVGVSEDITKPTERTIVADLDDKGPYRLDSIPGIGQAL